MVSIIELVKAFLQTQDLAERIRLGEEIAHQIAPKLRLYIRSQTAIDVAEVIFQESLKNIFSKLHQFYSTTEGQFRAWCRSIARNEIRKDIRVKTRDLSDVVAPEVLEELYEAAPPPLSMADKLDLDYAMNLLRQAKPPCYHYLWYSYVLEFSYDEIAKEFDLKSKAAARMQINRCLELAQSLIRE